MNGPSEQQESKSAASTTDLASERTGMATERTIMAAERTLMAWIRTAISLISFGFTLFKFLQSFADIESKRPGRMRDPKELGLTLIGLGMVALIFAIIQHIGRMRHLGVKERRRVWSLSVVFAIAFWFVGAWALLNVAFG